MAERITDIGPPNYEKFLPPVIKKNYGKWKYHEILEPGRAGARVPSPATSSTPSRGGSPRLMSIQTIREICDLADKYCDGYLRFTSRNNIEFLLADPARSIP